MSTESCKEPSRSQKNRADHALLTFSKVVHGAFWVLLFVAFPLTLNPAALALNGSIEQGILMPKALVLGVVRVVALGMVVYLLFGLTWFATLAVDPIV